ncbi:hypothetical protein SeMB42_g04470 [Synchytrium endobioticum]|uniref:Selenoprotein H n=1 Tax=Synchytrium endobioticum TaxID=286115 RepID=A0A507CY82_9FUNG|nr:hypothetical protein SeMB42_g04470 [Synchytrium endobioticum]TPX44859.1 hypothetical protein SeLEV6574_g04264 [Synchytrium endobioticum]
MPPKRRAATKAEAGLVESEDEDVKPKTKKAKKGQPKSKTPKASTSEEVPLEVPAAAAVAAVKGNVEAAPATQGETAGPGEKGNIIIESCNTCSTYKSKGNKLAKLLMGTFPNANVAINPSKPRPKSFDVIVNGKNVWSGFTKGPPRTEKFPDDETIVTLVKEAYLSL